MLWLALPAPGGNIIPEWQSLRSLLGATNPCGTAKAYKRRALRVAGNAPVMLFKNDKARFR